MDYQFLMPRAFCSSVGVLNLTADLCRMAIEDKIPGQFCEAGVAFGVHGVVMNDVAKGEKEVWMLDSFEGISTHSKEDLEWTEAHGEPPNDPRKSGGITVCSLRQVKETFLQAGQDPDEPHMVYVQGWFVDTLPTIESHANLKFAVLRLDCDLYDPYSSCLKYLYPKLSIGGYLIIDDIVLSGCQQAIIDYGLRIDDFTIDDNKMAWLKKK
jgi:O-methyltransferase